MTHSTRRPRRAQVSRLPLLSALLLTGLAGQAIAEPHTFKIPAGAAASALREFARQANLQTLFDYRLVSKLQTQAVSGDLEPEDALQKMLVGTGLTFERVDEHTIAIRDPAAPKTTDDLNGAGARLDEVVVASRLPNSEQESATPVEVYTREKIARSGTSTVADFLNTLPAVSVQTTGTGEYQQPNGSTTVQLRGLPAGTTLVMLNGRRVQTSGASGTVGFFDLNSIPIAAVERIEVMPTGSSAVYGGDALGGIVNIVLRQDFTGIEVDARYGGSPDGAYHDSQYSFAAGGKGDRWSASLVGIYSQNTELSGNERPLTANQNYTRYGGLDNRYPYTNPGNVCTANGANLTGLNVPCAAIPAGSTGVGLTPASFAATAGRLNETSVSSFYSFIAPSQHYGAYAAATYQIDSNTEVFAELMYNHMKQELYVYPPLGVVGVPASNPNNPFGQDLSVDYLFSGAGRICGQCVSSDYYRPLLGVRGKAFSTWSWEVAAWTSRDNTSVPIGFTPLNTAAINAAVAAGTFNPLAAGAGAAPGVLKSLVTPAPNASKGSLDSLNAFTRGTLADWYAGPIDAVIGGEYERDQTIFAAAEDVYNGSFDYSRNAQAAFAELKLPLIAGLGIADPSALLTAQFATRYDHYSDFGGRASYGASLEFKPTRPFLVRASYSTAFKPPSLYQLHAPTTTDQGLTGDPARGGQQELTTIASGGNPTLKAETGWSSNLGIVYTPGEARDIELSLTHWTVRLDNGFVSPGSNVIVAHPDVFPGRIVRAPPAAGDPYGVGPITYIDQSFANFGFAREAGVDFGATWRAATPVGTITPSVAATEVYRYDFEFAPGTGALNAVSQANDQAAYAPRWKGTVTLNWQRDPFQAGVTGRYTGAYKDVTDIRPNPLTLGNFWYVDLNVRVELGRLVAPADSFWSKLFVAGGARNVLNKLPVYSDSGLGFSGYDPNEYDLLGRYLWVQTGLVL